MMKLILFVAVVMFKCSRLSSSAPADSLDTNNKNSENEFNPNQIAYAGGRAPSLSYVSDIDDLGTTGVVFQFRRSIKSDNTEIEARRRSALDKGFMRFGRAGGNMLRFGRSPGEEPDGETSPRERKSDKNLLRFGRAGFMRFGRNFVDDTDPEDYNDAREVEDIIERPVLRSPSQQRHEEHGNNILRFGRSSSESTSNEYPAEAQPSSEKTDARNGNKKSTETRNMLRFGRANNNMLRFGRGNVMRFGKRANMLRFGRAHYTPSSYLQEPNQFVDNRQTRGSNDKNLLRFGRAGNLIRFGRNEKNIMRFGKRSGPQAVSSSTRIYCEDDDCVVAENENQTGNENAKDGDHLQELFGSDSSPGQGYGEFVSEK